MVIARCQHLQSDSRRRLCFPPIDYFVAALIAVAVVELVAEAGAVSC